MLSPTCGLAVALNEESMKDTTNRFPFLLLLVVAQLFAGTPAHAQDKTSDIDKIFSWATPSAPGCVAALSQHGKLVVNRAYGLAVKDGLMAHLNDSPDQSLEFRPVGRDIFQRGTITVRFRRDTAGAVVGFDFSNPVLRNI